jgi:hypothetical protein
MIGFIDEINLFLILLYIEAKMRFEGILKTKISFRMVCYYFMIAYIGKH